MAYPPFEEYQDALRQPPQEIFSDPVLAAGTIVRLRSGEPFARTGNFALTYQVVSGHRSYAVRCFPKPCDSLAQRYDAIARRFEQRPSPYFVDFEFQPEGIRTESGRYPLLRMDWVDGDTLASYVADHFDDAVTLQQLRASVRVMARQLAALGIAHGDIQPGNVIVRDATDLKLVDYDGLYVPELASLGSIELGQRNFRHPGRRTRHYDARLDSFPFAVIDLALGALAYRPELWQIARCDESALILRAEDYIDPWSSLAFGWLRDVPGLDVKAQHLAAICQAPFEEVPGIEDFLAGRNIPAPRIRVSGVSFRPQRPLYLPAYPVVDAANVAQCVAHVGDQVELIGRVRRARTAELSLSDGGLVRIEFGTFPEDMVVLQLHTVDAQESDAALDEFAPGVWASAIGLVAPPHTERVDGQPCKMVTIQILHRSQVTRLPESEAQHRLTSGLRSAPGVIDAPTGRVGTDPAVPEFEIRTVVMDSPAEIPPASTVEAAPAVTERPAPPVPGPAIAAPPPWVRRRRFVWPSWWPWLAVAAAVLTLVALFPHDASPPEAPVDTPVVAAPAGEGDPVMRPPVAGEAQPVSPAPPRSRDLRSARPPVVTRAGMLSVARSGGTAVMRINDETLGETRARAISLHQQTFYDDREVITGLADCPATAARCNGRIPFWLTLRDGEIDYQRLDAAAATAGSGQVTSLPSGVHIELGVRDGLRRTALLTSRGDPWLASVAEPKRRLDRNECRQVLRALESCAAIRGCRSLSGIARALPAAQVENVRRLFHETTGLDASGFRSVCLRSCELGLTPTRAFVQQRVCSGALPDQWQKDLFAD
jgi:hypothetical protein